MGGLDLSGPPGYAFGSTHKPAWNRAEKTWYNHNGAFARRVFVATKEKRIFLVSWRLESADFEWHCPICPAQQTKRSKQPLWHNNYGIAVVWNKCQYSVYGKINRNAYNNVSKILQSTCKFQNFGGAWPLWSPPGYAYGRVTCRHVIGRFAVTQQRRRAKGRMLPEWRSECSNIRDNTIDRLMVQVHKIPWPSATTVDLTCIVRW